MTIQSRTASYSAILVTLILLGFAPAESKRSTASAKQQSQISDATSHLLAAIRTRNVSLAKCAVEEGADVLVVDEFGNTPLHLAVKSKNSDMLKLLIERNTSVNDRNSRGQTALHIAANYRLEEMIRILLAAGARVNARDQYSQSPLTLAVLGGSQSNIADGRPAVPSVNLLLQHGARLNKLRDNDTLLHGAALYGDAELCKVLIDSGIGVNAKGSYRCTPLHEAVMGQHYAACKVLLEHGAKPNVYNRISGWYDEVYTSFPLECAIGNCNPELVSLLLQHGATWRSMHLHPPLVICAKRSSPEKRSANHIGALRVAAMLLAIGCNPNTAEPRYHRRPLHEAASEGSYDMARLLLEHGADVNLVQQGNIAALHCALGPPRNRTNTLAIVSLLVGFGADVNMSTDDGDTPLSFARQWQTQEVVDYLIKCGAK